MPPPRCQDGTNNPQLIVKTVLEELIGVKICLRQGVNKLRLLLLLGSVGVCAVACGPMPDRDPFRGKPAPDFEVQTLQSAAATKTIVSMKGKPIILDFWATWCGPCRMLSPHVERVYEEFKDKGLQAMAISDQNREDVLKFESQTPHKIPVYIDQNEIATAAYRVEALPTVVIIDKKGNVVYHQTGFNEGQLDETEAAMKKAVQDAINDPS
jgi:thiol-disulfide isomerase/thioredoxin